jgi:hypothetical protein
VEASGTAAADTGVGTEAGTEAEATGVVSAVDAERLAARLGAATGAATGAAGVVAATGAGAATTGVATAAGVAVFLVTVFLETEELMFVLVAGIEFICLKRTDYHSGGQKQSIFIKIVSKNLQFQEKNLFFLKTGHIYDLF